MAAKCVVIDGGFGNLFSLGQALRRLGVEAEFTSDPTVVSSAERLILPGVGAFGAAVAAIDRLGLRQPLVDFAASGRPFLGICIGMQLLFEDSEESPEAIGLGIIPGEVRKLPRTSERLKIPHMGWNTVHWDGAPPSGVTQDGHFYFVHSYACYPEDEAATWGTTTYGTSFAAAVRQGSITAAQFHPEKSQHEGAAFLEGFLRQ